MGGLLLLELFGGSSNLGRQEAEGLPGQVGLQPGQVLEGANLAEFGPFSQALHVQHEGADSQGTP